MTRGWCAVIELVYQREPQQILSTEKMRDLPGFFDMSDPGTGKTFTEIYDFAHRRMGGGGRALVVGGKSILQSAWGDEIDRAAPGMLYGVATANNREQPFLDSSLDVVITNPAALKQVAHNAPKWLKGFDTFILDESTCVKNPQTQTFKAARQIARQMSWRRCLSGTPNPNTVLDFWAQAYLLDNGERLSNSYWKFRNVVCTPTQIGPDPRHIEWVDKEGVETAIFDLLSDISIRHKLEGVPENRKSHYHFKLPRHARKIYDDMVKHAIAELAPGTEVTAVHAASLMQKLLQIAAGAVYVGEAYSVIDDGRVEMVMELLEERAHSLVLFQWRHQREMLAAAMAKRGWPYAVIDGETPDHERPAIVRDFQAGRYKAILAHPKSAGHGLTLTTGKTTIWVSPTWSSELFTQANARIHRKGQTDRTETIMISAEDTVDKEVYERLGGKLQAMELILSLMEHA